MAGGLSVIGAILAIIGTGAIVGLAIYGGVTLLDLIESRVNERAFRKAIDDSLTEHANGDSFPEPIIRKSQSGHGQGVSW